MSYSEERLYYACTNFCKAFFKLLCEKDKVRSEWCPDDEKDVRLRFANEQLGYTYERLFKAIEDWENECKGVMGQNKYKLKLEKIGDSE